MEGLGGSPRPIIAQDTSGVQTTCPPQVTTLPLAYKPSARQQKHLQFKIFRGQTSSGVQDKLYASGDINSAGGRSSCTPVEVRSDAQPGASRASGVRWNLYVSGTSYCPGVLVYLYASESSTGVQLLAPASNELAAIAYFLLVSGRQLNDGEARTT